MATVRDYFDTDFPYHWRCLGTGVSADGEPEVSVRVNVDMDACAKFISVYVPRTTDTLDYCRRVISVLPDVFKMKYLNGLKVPQDDPSHIGFKLSCGINEATKALTFAYTMHDLYNFTIADEALHDSKFIFLYVDYEFSFEEWKQLQICAVRYGYCVRLRDLSYARKRSESDHPAAFISYDHRDKQLARPLALALRQRKLIVWFDEFELNPGDRIRKSIDEGLQKCKKCIVLLSPSYLANKRWATYELNTVIVREVTLGSHILIPVWVGVTKDDIYRFNPQLLDIVGVTWAENEQLVADQLMKALL